MSDDLISEPNFLITELRYTLGQLQAQLGGLGGDVMAEGQDVASSVQSILNRMAQNERRYQEQYARLTGKGMPEGEARSFSDLRLQTIAMLESAGDDWPPQLRELVQQQVAGDREATTQIAEARRAMFEHGQRPDLEQPLTTDPHPHVKEGE